MTKSCPLSWSREQMLLVAMFVCATPLGTGCSHLAEHYQQARVGAAGHSRDKPEGVSAWRKLAFEQMLGSEPTYDATAETDTDGNGRPDTIQFFADAVLREEWVDLLDDGTWDLVLFYGDELRVMSLAGARAPSVFHPRHPQRLPLFWGSVISCQAGVFEVKSKNALVARPGLPVVVADSDQQYVCRGVVSQAQGRRILVAVDRHTLRRPPQVGDRAAIDTGSIVQESGGSAEHRP